jgi:hypothetical protein
MKPRIVLLVVVFVALLASAASAVAINRITVGTSATLIFTAPPAGVARVLIRNPGAVSVYVGPAGVTTATGFEIAAGDSVGLNLSYGDPIYGVVAAATQVVYTISGANPQ